MKTKKERILVLVAAKEQSARYIQMGYDVAKQTKAELYILHIANTKDIQEHEKMEILQDLAQYTCSLGGQCSFIWDKDIKTTTRNFVKQNGITQILVEPSVKFAKKQSKYQWMQTLLSLLPIQTIILSEQPAFA